MIVQDYVEKEQYYDSVFLMRTAAKLGNIPGVIQISAGMGTPLNKDTMKELGVLDATGEKAGVNDMVVGIAAETEAIASEAYAEFLKLLKTKKKTSAAAHRTIDQAFRANPSMNLAMISVAGEYAAREGMAALKHGMNVFMFSDNVPIEQEAEMKQYAREHGLLMMGPDCGLTFLDGAAIGLCSKTRRGSIGIAGASGSGVQEVMAIVHRKGYGISQAIGTGGRDLSNEVGGITMLQSIALLDQDPDTKAIALISKPPARETMAKVLSAVEKCSKPVVIQFIHGDAEEIRQHGGYPTFTFLETAEAVIAFSKGEKPARHEIAIDTKLAESEAVKLGTSQKYLRGLYCGGSLAEEALMMMSDRLGEMYSNVAFGDIRPLDDPFESKGNCLTDIGAEEFTKAHPHAAIDPTIRVRRMLKEAADPETAVILMDVLLGYALNDDPAGAMVPAIREIQEKAAKAGQHISIIIDLCGTDMDPQGYDEQKKAFEEAGAIVTENNEAAASLAAEIIVMKRMRDAK